MFPTYSEISRLDLRLGRYGKKSFFGHLNKEVEGNLYLLMAKKQKPSERRVLLEVVTEGIEPPTQGFSVLCSTN